MDKNAYFLSGEQILSRDICMAEEKHSGVPGIKMFCGSKELMILTVVNRLGSCPVELTSIELLMNGCVLEAESQLSPADNSNIFIKNAFRFYTLTIPSYVNFSPLLWGFD